jgi:hypothetical protein
LVIVNKPTGLYTERARELYGGVHARHRAAAEHCLNRGDFQSSAAADGGEVLVEGKAAELLMDGHAGLRSCNSNNYRKVIGFSIIF